MWRYIKSSTSVGDSDPSGFSGVKMCDLVVADWIPDSDDDF